VSSDTNGLGLKFASANCPDGKKVLGGGGVLQAPLVKDLGVTSSLPLVNNVGWTVRADELNSYGDEWSVRADAVCATVAE
jgi:hypothetical protein